MGNMFEVLLAQLLSRLAHYQIYVNIHISKSDFLTVDIFIKVRKAKKTELEILKRY